MALRPVLTYGTFLMLIFVSCAQTASKWPLPEPQDNFNLGVNIQRTMQRLQASNEGKDKEEIRILFYGQSFVKQAYWLAVVADLKKRFPKAKLTVQNSAIGGFTNSFLAQTIKIDALAFYPDLLIYQAQGSHHALDSTISLLRKKTTAEIVLMNSIWKVEDEQNPALGWSERYSHTHIPTIAAKYGCGYIDTRTLWHRYLNKNNLKAETLLDETAHMNEYGEFLHAELVKPYFTYQPDHPNLNHSGEIHVLHKGEDFNADANGLSFSAKGNRIVLYFETGVPPEFEAEVYIDGKKPSQFKGGFTATRPNGKTDADWPWEVYAFYNVEWHTLPLEETWKLTVTEVDGQSNAIKFKVEGSRTGFDGYGESEKTFVSNSGRVVIEPLWWHLKRSYGFMSAKKENEAMTAGRTASEAKETAKPIAKGHLFEWQLEQLGMDRIAANTVADRNGILTVAQGIPNTEHQITLKTTKEFADLITRIKVYEPSLQELQ